MNNLSLIVAIGKNNELGKDNDLIWHLKEDMKFFKKMTNNKTIIMGRKCFESLPGLLPNRKHIILSTNKNYKVDGALVMNNMEDVLNYIKSTNEECFIIGGGKIYEMFLPYCDKLYITEIDDEKEADVYFPKFDKSLYDMEILDEIEEKVKYKFILYKKKRTGKLIVIEGTDCSGKQTQAEKLVEHLNKDGIDAIKFGFPNYDSPTGKIVGGPYLGKSYICDGWFPEGAPNVSGKVASLYYAADRLYNVDIINKSLEEGKIVILDRYVESNMAFQGSKFETKEKRKEMFEWLETLEYKLLELPRPDKVIFLYMPYEYACELKKCREEKPDQNESSEELLRRAESTYLELADMYNYSKIDCVDNDRIKTIDEIHKDVYDEVLKSN
ncbi:MAG: dTMP kinase [Bacilli bacterium]|nr:dTMP kinase [Bacilli bacterium]